MTGSRRLATPGVLAVMGLFIAGLWLYWPLVSFPPVWDDHTFVRGQAFLRDPANLSRLFTWDALRSPLATRGTARPLWQASVLLDAFFFGRAYWGFHLTNLLWHALGAAFVLTLAYRLCADRLTAAAAAVLFLVHPVHVEAVALVTYRSDLMAFAFMTAALVLALKPGRRYLAASGAVYAAALLSKEMAAAFPLVLLLAAVLAPAPRPAARGALWLASLAVVTLLYAGFRTPRSGYRLDVASDVFSALQGAGAQRQASGPQTYPWLLDYYRQPSARLRGSLAIFADDLRLLLWPARLQADYAPRPPRRWLDRRVAAGALALAALLLGAWALRRRLPLACFGLLWVPLTLLPVCGLFLLRNPQAERYLYVPSAGICLAAAAALQALMRSGPRGKRAAAVLFTGLVSLSGLRVYARLWDYRSDVALHEATVRVDPLVPRAFVCLGEAYAEAGRPDEARLAYRRALDLWPEYRSARVQLDWLERRPE